MSRFSSRLLPLHVILALASALVVTRGASPAAQSDETLDDGQFAERHLSAAFLDALADAPVRDSSLAISPMPGQNPNDLVRKSLVQAALARGEQVYESSPGGARDPGVLSLRYRLVDVRLDVAREGFPFLWAHRYRRRLCAQVLLELTSADRGLVWSRAVAAEATDVVSSADYRNLQNAESITRREIPRRSYLLEGFAAVAVAVSFLLLAR